MSLYLNLTYYLLTLKEIGCLLMPSLPLLSFLLCRRPWCGQRSPCLPPMLSIHFCPSFFQGPRCSDICATRPYYLSDMFTFLIFNNYFTSSSPSKPPLTFPPPAFPTLYTPSLADEIAWSGLSAASKKLWVFPQQGCVYNDIQLWYSKCRLWASTPWELIRNAKYQSHSTPDPLDQNP